MFGRTVVGLVVLLATAEFAARAMGFCTPPLLLVHPTIEYMFAPDQDVKRFHHRVFYNQWGMRSGPVGQSKTDESEFRVLTLGDSVVSGGSSTDQSELATTIFSQGNMRALNASVGSWVHQTCSPLLRLSGSSMPT